MVHLSTAIGRLRRLFAPMLFGLVVIVGIAACDPGLESDATSIDLPNVEDDASEDSQLAPDATDDTSLEPEDTETFDPFDALPTTDDTNDWSELRAGDPAVGRDFACPGVVHVATQYPALESDGIQLGNGNESVTVLIRIYPELSGLGQRAVEWVDQVSLNECNPVRVPVGNNGTEVEDLNFVTAVSEFVDPITNSNVDAAVAWRTERRFVGGAEAEVAAHTVSWTFDDVYVSVTGTVRVSDVDGGKAVAANSALQIAERFVGLTQARLAGVENFEVTGEDQTQTDATTSLPDVSLGCEPEEIGESSGRIVSAYEVQRGDVIERCLGSDDERLLTAWRLLAEVADEDDLANVVLIAGYESETSDTLAFAGPLFDRNEQFVIAVLLDAVEDDPVELRLTMVHELAHVITQVPSQYTLDHNSGPNCALSNGVGCFLPGSLMGEWAAGFWAPEQLSSLPESGATDEDGGEERCVIDPTFLGSYAASHPEEDFAETLAAFVFDIDVPEEILPKLEFMAEQPAFVDMRDRARALGASDLPNNFERCG